MAGRVVVSTLNDDTGVLLTQNGMRGIAKAWVNYNGIAQTIRDSFNVSSVTRNNTGDYTINFTTAMPNANYGFAGTSQGAGGGNIFIGVEQNSGVAPTTSAIRILVKQSATALDRDYVCVSIFSS